MVSEIQCSQTYILNVLIMEIIHFLILQQFMVLKVSDNEDI